MMRKMLLQMTRRVLLMSMIDWLQHCLSSLHSLMMSLIQLLLLLHSMLSLCLTVQV